MVRVWSVRFGGCRVGWRVGRVARCAVVQRSAVRGVSVCGESVRGGAMSGGAARGVRRGVRGQAGSGLGAHCGALILLS